ncbi:hypothetical protein D3C75_1200340 [compost metagenome]
MLAGYGAAVYPEQPSFFTLHQFAACRCLSDENVLNADLPVILHSVHDVPELQTGKRVFPQPRLFLNLPKAGPLRVADLTALHMSSDGNKQSGKKRTGWFLLQK